MTEEIELFVPQPGSVAWRVLTHLMAKPDDILMRKDVARLTGCQLNSVDVMLQKAVVRQCLLMFRNSALEVTWRLGIKQNFRLDKLVENVASAPTAAPLAAPTAPAASTIDRLIASGELHASPLRDQPAADAPRVKRKYTRRKGVNPQAETRRAQAQPDELKVPYFGESKAQHLAETTAPTKGAGRPEPMTVSMPLAMTPEMIDAVRNDPLTSFENKAESHQAIGWLLSAYEVLVKAQQKNPGAR